MNDQRLPGNYGVADASVSPMEQRLSVIERNLEDLASAVLSLRDRASLFSDEEVSTLKTAAAKYFRVETPHG